MTARKQPALDVRTLRWVARRMTAASKRSAMSRDAARANGRDLVAECRQSDVETQRIWAVALRQEARAIERKRAPR